MMRFFPTSTRRAIVRVGVVMSHLRVHRKRKRDYKEREEETEAGDSLLNQLTLL